MTSKNQIRNPIFLILPAVIFIFLGFQVPRAFATPLPPCPFNPQTNRTIVNFIIGGRIVAVSEAIVSDTQNYPQFSYKKESLPATLTAGKYNITLFGADVAIDRASLITEPNEKWFVILSNGSSEVARTGTTDDLQDGVNTATQEKIVNTNLELSADINSFVAFNASYPDTSSPNSLYPICAAFDLIPPPAIPPIQDNGIYNSATFAIPPVEDQAIINGASIAIPAVQDNGISNQANVAIPPVQDQAIVSGASVAIPPVQDNNGVGGSVYIPPVQDTVVPGVVISGGGGGCVSGCGGGVVAVAPPVIVYSPTLPYTGLRDKNKGKNTLWNLPQLIAKEFNTFTKTLAYHLLGGENNTQLASASNYSIGIPERIIIPSIKVDASIESLGLTPGKAMDVPKDVNNAGWFSLGPRPGERGTSVIDGHYGWVGKRKVVFDDLDRLKTGDNINIKDSNGKVVTFVVRETRQYNAGDNASDVFFTESKSSRHLNLITCDGEWNVKEQNYGKRLVVFADMVEVEREMVNLTFSN